MTAYLDEAIPKENPNKKILRYIGEEIYSQLSDYAKTIISRNGYMAESHSVSYRNDESLAKSRENAMMYLFKSGTICSFSYKDVDGSLITSRGRISPEGKDNVMLSLLDGTELIKHVSEVEIVLDSYDYK